MTKTKPKIKKVTYKFSKTKIKKIAELLEKNKRNIEFGARGNFYKVKLLSHGQYAVLAIHEPKENGSGNWTIEEFFSARCKNNITTFNCSIYQNKDILKAAERGVGISFIKWFNPETNSFE